MKGTCSTCDNFCASTRECRGEMPQATLAPDESGAFKPVSFWPPTRADFWCGQWTPMPTASTIDTERAARQRM